MYLINIFSAHYWNLCINKSEIKRVEYIIASNRMSCIAQDQSSDNECVSHCNVYKTYNDFLINHTNPKSGSPTHTRIGDRSSNIYGASYNIPNNKLREFYEHYYDHIFVKGRKEYLTEKQLGDESPILVDFDFKYDWSVTERKHDESTISDMVQAYIEELKNFFVFEEGSTFPIYIMEKKTVNRVAEKKITKDGIHMIIGLQMNHILQLMLRERMIKELEPVFESLELSNDIPNVLDEGISKGTTNWQLYGSCKPNHDSYVLTYFVNIKYTNSDFEIIPSKVTDFDVSKNLELLSAQYNKHLKLDLNQGIMTEYTSKLGKIKKSSSKPKIAMSVTTEADDDSNSFEHEPINYAEITNKDILVREVDKIMNNLNTNEYYIKEIHEFTQILPEKYYASGSHLNSRMVAFALKHTSERLFLSWVMLRSKSDEFDYGKIESYYNDWCTYYNKKNDGGGLTKSSIIYWAKQDAPDEYLNVKQQTVNHFVNLSVDTATDFDFAMVLWAMYKDKYVCSSITAKQWYVFTKHSWELDGGHSLRLAISKEVFAVYQTLLYDFNSRLKAMVDTDPMHPVLTKKIIRIADVSLRLKKTTDKNNIMREAMELFYDKNFIKNIDSNPYLLCCENGVIDYKLNLFRTGVPTDYLTKTTRISYHPLDKTNENTEKIRQQIITFLQQLFPIPEVFEYMKQHLASCLIGIKMEQDFNIYRGSGSNGKSLLTDLMAHTLGDYKGTVPVTLVTDKRNSIGGTSSEVMQLKGIRYAVMQEASKEATINEGVMKELTGGDPLQARALYCDSEIFMPQFSLVVCTNELFEFKSNDDGTWRRVKLVDFLSKFASPGETFIDTPKYKFEKDKGLKAKLPIWAPIFLSMLVEIGFETKGVVQPCEEVSASSNKYRQDQDCFSGFIGEMIVVQEGGTIGKREMGETFKEWYQLNYGKRAPRLYELNDRIIKKFGAINPKTGKWHNIAVKVSESNDLTEL